MAKKIETTDDIWTTVREAEGIVKRWRSGTGTLLEAQLAIELEKMTLLAAIAHILMEIDDNLSS